MPGNWAPMMACASSSAERLAGVWLSDILRMRSIGGSGMGVRRASGGFPAAALRGGDAAADDGVVVQPCALGGGGDAGVRRRAGMEVDRQDRRAGGSRDRTVHA